MSKDAEIKFTIQLDEQKVPQSIFWEATDSEFDEKKPCDSIMISMWDRAAKNTLSIDLWTNDMEIGEMDAHFYFTFMKMAETYYKSTKNKELADMIAHFAQDFAKKIEENAKLEKQS